MHKNNYAILHQAHRVLASTLLASSIAYVEVLIGKTRVPAGMAELADAADSKSAEGNLVGVRPPLPAPR